MGWLFGALKTIIGSGLAKLLEKAQDAAATHCPSAS
jgi:hypothetical protein